MIHILMRGNVEKGKWADNFCQFERQEIALKRFNKASRLRTRRRRNKAIHTLLPHQYLSGDTIMFCLDAVRYKPPQETETPTNITKQKNSQNNTTNKCAQHTLVYCNFTS